MYFGRPKLIDSREKRRVDDIFILFAQIDAKPSQRKALN